MKSGQQARYECRTLQEKEVKLRIMVLMVTGFL
jgi:hypothetical protein